MIQEILKNSFNFRFNLLYILKIISNLNKRFC
jgi:hypothetical protein